MARICRLLRLSINSTRKFRRWAAGAGTHRACSRGWSGETLELNHRAVVRDQQACALKLVAMREHSLVHMRDHDPARIEIGEPRLENGPSQVAGDAARIA